MFVRKKPRWDGAKPPVLPSIGSAASPEKALVPAPVKSESRPSPTPLKPEPKDTIPALAPTLPAPVNHPDAHAGAAGVLSSGQDQHPGRLVIGRDIRLKGEITACDELIVDGDLDAAVVAQHLKISSGGAVVGQFEVRTADIGGRFTGDLIVRENLSIRAGGQIEGRVRYGTIEVAMGGVIRGDLDELGRTSDRAEASADSVGATTAAALENAS